MWFIFLTIFALTGVIFYLVLADPTSNSGVTSSSSTLPNYANNPVKLVNGVQEVNVQLTPYGYNSDEIHVKQGIPVKFMFTAQSPSCGSILIMRDFNVRLQSTGTTAVAEFTPTIKGTFPFSCPMNMYRGKLIVE